MKKSLIVIFSFLLSITNISYIKAEELDPNNEDGKDQSSSEVIEETTVPESTLIPTEDSDNNNNSLNDVAEASYGYIPSDLDFDTPVYYSDENLYGSSVETYIPDYSKYPGIRNQNPYGTCWAFSSLGLAEFDLINDGKATSDIDLSELQLAYFTYNYVVDPLGGTEGDTYIDSSSKSFLERGGNYVYASRRLMQWISPTEEKRVLYDNVASVLSDGLDSSYAYSNIQAHLSNVYLVNIKENQDEVKKMIMEHGAVGVSYYDVNTNHLYNSTIGKNVFYDTSSSVSQNHAVMIIGWDDTFSKDYFMSSTKPTSDGAWLVRNSWGKNNFDYFWMSYETGSLSDTAWVFDFVKDDGFDNNYQLDGNYKAGYINSTSTTVANIFTVQRKDEIASESLKAVSLSYMEDANVSYEVNVYTNLSDVSNPYSGTLIDKATTIGKTTYAGVYTIKLASEVELQPGTTFAIVVKTNDGKINCESGTSDNTGGKGKSLYLSGSSFRTWNNGNFCIKAYTSNNETDHNWDLGTITTQPTCLETGVKTYTCTRCGGTKTETIDALGHVYSTEWTIDQEATTSSEGSKSHHCTRENCNSKTDITTIPKLISFIDVNSETSHVDAINWLASTKISEGWENKDGTREFRPYSAVKRCDMSAFLKRLGGVLGDKTISSYTPSNWDRFVDVAKGDGIHEVDILWLADNEISTGWNDGTFRPLNDVTRADMAAFLRRLAKKYNIGDAATWTPSESDWATFSDLTRGDDYHQEDILWLAHAGISQGWSMKDGTKEFRPMETVKRCDMAAFLQRLANLASK